MSSSFHRRAEPWLLGTIFVGLVATSCVLALHAVVTFPTALFTGAVGAFALFPPEHGRSPRHYALLVALGLASLTATLVLHRLGW